MLTEILSGLWIGNINDSYNQEFYKDNLITIAINCTDNQSFLDLPDLQKLRVPLSINMDPKTDIDLLSKSMNKITEFIHKNIEKHNIIVFCYNGLTISPLIVGVYMINYGNISKDHIRDILRCKNENICLDFDLSLF